MRGALVGLAGVIGRPVLDQAGGEIGTVVDAVARWDGDQANPPVTGLIVRVGRRRAWLPISAVEDFGRDLIRLRSSRLDLRDFTAREGEVDLARDVVDHQLVDTDGARVVRASDLYLARVAGVVQLAGADIGFGSIVRRLGPKRYQVRPTPDKVIDWASTTSFGAQRGPGGLLQHPSGGCSACGPVSSLTCWRTSVGLSARSCWRSCRRSRPPTPSRKMQSEELVQLLCESETADAADLLGRMEPDEAADGLQELDTDEQEQLRAAMPPEASERVATLLGYGERTAGGVMTTLLMTTSPSETIGEVRERLRAERGHEPCWV